MDPTGIAEIGLTVLRQVMAFISAERARTGKTYEEIFDDATSQIDANETALRADLGDTGPVLP